MPMNSTQWQQLVDEDALHSPESCDPLDVMESYVHAGVALPCFGRDPVSCSQENCGQFSRCLADSLN